VKNLMILACLSIALPANAHHNEAGVQMQNALQSELWLGCALGVACYLLLKFSPKIKSN